MLASLKLNVSWIPSGKSVVDGGMRSFWSSGLAMMSTKPLGNLLLILTMLLRHWLTFGHFEHNHARGRACPKGGGDVRFFYIFPCFIGCLEASDLLSSDKKLVGATGCC